MTDDDGQLFSARTRASGWDRCEDSPTKEVDRGVTPSQKTGCLKKPRVSIGNKQEADSNIAGEAEKAVQECALQMKEMQCNMIALLQKVHGPDVDAMTMVAGMCSKNLVTLSVGEDQEDSSEVSGDKEITQQMKSPRPCVMEPPSSSAWDHPLSRDEKKARVVMIDQHVSSLEIDSLSEALSRARV